jgi:oxaloacetate decarboxylase alpha subunit
VVRYVLGKFGRPTRRVDKAVEAAILDRPRAREIEREADFPALADLRKRFGATMDEEEFLLRAVMPGDQVDSMLKSGRSRSHYSPELAPVLALLKQLAARPAVREMVVERPGFRLVLRAGAGV